MYPASDSASPELSSPTRHRRYVRCFASPFRRAALSLRSTAALLIVIAFGFCSIAHANVELRAHFVSAANTLFNGANNGLSGPYDVAVDGSGNIYIADNSNNRVVKETLSGGAYTQTTIGNGMSGPSGVAVDASGNVYIADFGNNRVLLETWISGSSYTQTVLFESGLSRPFDVLVDGSGDVYISDSGNGRVVLETLSLGTYTPTDIVTGLSVPYGLALDVSGNIYITDSNVSAVYKETLSLGSYTQTTVGSGFTHPYGVAVDGNGNLYIADLWNSRVLLETWNSGAGTYTQSVFANLSWPAGVALDGSGNLHVALYGNSRVVEVQTSADSFGAINVGTTSSKMTMTFAFDSPGILGSTAVLTQGATGLDFADARSGTCAATTAYNTGDTCSIDVTFTPKFAGTRYGALVLKDNSGNVAATGYVFGIGTGPQVNFLPGSEITVATKSNSLVQPQGLALDGSGNVYIADYGSNAVYEAAPLGTPTKVVDLSGSGGTPECLAVDGAGNLYIADSANSQVLKESPSGSGYAQTVVANLASNRLYSSGGVAVDQFGNVYIADTDNGRILKETVSGSGYVQSVVPTSSLDQPYAVAVDTSGNVYVTDTTTGC